MQNCMRRVLNEAKLGILSLRQDKNGTSNSIIKTNALRLEITLAIESFNGLTFNGSQVE